MFIKVIMHCRDHGFIPRSNIVEYKPTDEHKIQNHYLYGTVTSMRIMADLNSSTA